MSLMEPFLLFGHTFRATGHRLSAIKALERAGYDSDVILDINMSFDDNAQVVTCYS
jgi:hypothetical protein